MFAVEGISDGGKVAESSFSLGAGEILGLAGLVGAGRTEMSRLIFGIDKKLPAESISEGTEIAVDSPGDAIAVVIDTLRAGSRAFNG